MTDSLLFSHGLLNPTAKMPEKEGAVVSSPVHRPPKDGLPGLIPETLLDKQKISRNLTVALPNLI